MVFTKNLRFSFAPQDPYRPPNNLRRLLILIFLLASACTTYVGQPGSVSANLSPPDRLIVKRRKIVLVRSAELAKQFPHRKTATVIYPVVSGLNNRDVLRRVRSLLDFKNIFDSSLQDYREDSWLSEFSYTLNYNRNYLFDITFTQSGVAAYPDDQSKHFLISLKNGRVIKAADVFLAEKLESLAALVDQKLQAELKQKARETREASDLEASDARSIVEGLEQLKFETGHLDDFSVTAEGITFLYDAGLPHVIKAFEPEGRYFFSYSELRTYLKRSGPLGQFVR